MRNYPYCAGQRRTVILLNSSYGFIVFYNCSFYAVSPPSPDSASDVVVHTGPDYVVVDWEHEEDTEGWEAEYTVTVIPIGTSSNSSNSSNVVRVTEAGSAGPPITVGGLDPETEYRVVLETRLGAEFTAEVEKSGIKTTANDSDLPKEIIGVTIVDYRKMYKSEGYQLPLKPSIPRLALSTARPSSPSSPFTSSWSSWPSSSYSCREQC